MKMCLYYGLKLKNATCADGNRLPETGRFIRQGSSHPHRWKNCHGFCHEKLKSPHLRTFNESG